MRRRHLATLALVAAALLAVVATPSSCDGIASIAPATQVVRSDRATAHGPGSSRRVPERLTTLLHASTDRAGGAVGPVDRIVSAATLDVGERSLAPPHPAVAIVPAAIALDLGALVVARRRWRLRAEPGEVAAAVVQSRGPPTSFAGSIDVARRRLGLALDRRATVVDVETHHHRSHRRPVVRVLDTWGEHRSRRARRPLVWRTAAAQGSLA